MKKKIFALGDTELGEKDKVLSTEGSGKFLYTLHEEFKNEFPEATKEMIKFLEEYYNFN